MKQFKVSTRLALFIAFSALMLVGTGLLGLWGMSRTSAALQEVYQDRVLPLVQLSEVERHQLQIKLGIEDALRHPEAEVRQRVLKGVDDDIAEIRRNWALYAATAMTPQEAKLAQALVEARAHYLKTGLTPVLEALRAGDTERARQFGENQLLQTYVPVSQGLATLIALQAQLADEAQRAAATRYERLRTATWAVLALGVAGAMLFGLQLLRSLTRQLGGEPYQAMQVARAVAAGDLTQPIALRVGDRSSLMASLSEMQASLRRTVAEVRSNADSVATASSEIAQGNLDLSQRTEEQASALQQTAASMDQLTDTVRQNADSARQARQLAEAASTVAQRGGAAVGEVVGTMQAINESSHRIADIVGVIDGIAFQTNILALNAAVEAARAGEEGRGFAVVASEVRSLAQRSAAAAKDVKQLIAESVGRVDAGTEQVGRAGTTMDEVVRSIRRVSDLVAEISAASEAQSTGVSQIGQAVAQMDQVTQQNAALVEESSAAAESLKSQAQQLQAAVSVFQLAARGPSAQRPGVPAHGIGSAPVPAQVPAFVPVAAPVPAAASGWSGPERRGPNRATNVVRPAFRAQPASENVASAPRRDGTHDDWQSF